MGRVLFLLVVLFHSLLYGQGEGGVFTAQRLASIKTGEGSLGNNPAALNWFQDLRNKTAKLGAYQTLGLEDIQGTVYLEENFKKGYIYYRYTLYGEYELRYDAFNDEVELRRENGNSIEALHKNEVISCQIEDEKFHYLAFKIFSNEIRKGYLITLHQGKNYTLYIRKEKIFKEGKPAKTSLGSSFPPRFLDEQTYFVSVDKGIPFQIRNSKKDILKLVDGNHRQRFKTFLKEKNLNIKEQSHLIQALVYMDKM